MAVEKAKEPKKKLPVVDGAKAPPDQAGKPAKGGKADKLKQGGWAAFTDGGGAPKFLVGFRLVMVLALAMTFPVLLGLAGPHGNRIIWTVCIAALPFFWTVAGYNVWRRVCPLAVVGQVGRLTGRPGTRKAGEWLSKNYLYVQLGLMLVGLSFRLIATNGSGTWLAGFLGVVAVVALVVSFTYAGKTWCNYLCPVGLVEKVHTEPSADARGDGRVTSQCSPCVACKKHCPDIDIEQGYWKEAQERPRRVAYFAWPGVVVGFYVYYWLVAHDWGYYFSGRWTYETNEPSQWLEPGFWFAHWIPRVVAAPLTLLVFGATSFLVASTIEWLAKKVALRGVPADAKKEEREAVEVGVHHKMLAVCGFTAFNAFYFFAGQPTLRRLPDWVVTGWSAIVVFASASIFFRRWGRKEADYVQEKFAEKILKKWEWGEAPPSDNLQDIYLLHTERTKQRESRLRAYKETVRELVADGTVTRAELVILDSLRAQLGVTDKEHQKVIAELSDEERQLFDPKYQGSVEQRLHKQQYRRDLERVVMEAARAGRAPAQTSLDALRRDHSASADEEAEELAKICAADGPVAALYKAEVAEVELLAAASAAAAPGDADGTESASRSLVRHLARWRGRQHVLSALGLLGALGPRPEIDQAREQIEKRHKTAASAIAVIDSALAAPLAHATARLFSEEGALAAEPILAIAGDGSPYVRAAVVLLLSRFDDDASRARVSATLDDAEPMVREAAVRSLGARSRLTRELLTKVLADPEARVRQAAVRAISGGTSMDMPAVDPAALAQTVKGVGNAGMFATLDDSARMASLTAIEKMMLLRQVPMFADLDPDDLDELADLVEERIYSAEGDLCKEGEAGDAVFLVVKGRVKVVKASPAGERVINELGPGACIGEMAVFDAAPRSATVRATERVRALVIPGEGFKTLMLDRPEMAQAIIAELVRRMRGMLAASGGPAGPATSGSMPIVRS
jgi:CRP-like cAMP-binding protein